MTTIKTTAVRLLWPVIKKPWTSPTMEFRYGLWRGLSALIAEDGRQLGEESTRPFYLNHHIPAETRNCKYAGSREGLAINVSALQLAMAHFDDALGIIGAVRQLHIEKSGGRLKQNEPLGLWDLHILSRACLALIAFKIRSRRERNHSDIVSNDLKSQYQFVSGVFMICRHMMSNAYVAIQKNNTLTAQELYSYADDNGIFKSPNGMVCAGAPKAIHAFLHLCVMGEVLGSKEPKADGPSILKNHIAHIDDWYQYALSCIALDFIVEKEIVRRKMAGDSDHSVSLRKIEKIHQDAMDYSHRNLRLDDDIEADDIEKEILRRQNAILDLLGKPTIREIPEKLILERFA